MASSEGEVADQPTVGDATSEPGLRERLLSLPVELFGEICSFLDAMELWHLSLTDETFWSVLASAKSYPIWHRSFKQTVPSMPKCPETMSPPSFARFMLVESCMVCRLKPWNMSLDYFHRVRYCDPCRQSNIISENTVLELYPDFPPQFLEYLSSNAVGSNGLTLGGVYYGSYRIQRNYLKETVTGVYKLWKSLSNTASIEVANARLIERLEKYANDRIWCGLKMRIWHSEASKWKSAQLAKLKEKRRAMVNAKLLELGYHRADFPGWHSEVYSAVALTAEEWERIRPIVIDATEMNKKIRIENERQARKNQRLRALSNLWNDVVHVASGTRAGYMSEKAICFNLDEFLDSAPVATLVEVDTDGILPQELESIRPHAQQFAIQRRQRYLVKLRNIRNGLPLDQVNEEEWSSLSSDETIAKLDTIAAPLVQAVNGFWDLERKTVDWYPSGCLSDSYVNTGVLSSVEGLAPGLIPKILKTIGKNPTIEARAVTSGSWTRNAVWYRCARCDERFAPHLRFIELISHYLEKKLWFDKASDAREKALIQSSGSKDPLSCSTILNDHDWNEEEYIIASDNSYDKARITKRQHQLEATYGNNPEDYDHEDFTTRSRRSAKKATERRPMYFAALKIHIEHV
ncbi:hypothetical protein FS837_005802 [Tulasnella sp. UAMH 9824]|nr:hypothetical protein FS837_005802 [Tulasnella sp. UAMH 9824]